MNYWMPRQPRKTVETVDENGKVTGVIVGSEEQIKVETDPSVEEVKP